MSSIDERLTRVFDDLRANEELLCTLGRFAFLSDKPNFDQLSYLWDLPAVKRVFITNESHQAKSQELAEQTRVIANQFFNAKDYKNALKKYNDCIVKAASGSKELGLAFANRSAVALKLGDYDMCMRDIELAFENAYPQDLRYKLMWRKAECYTQLGSTENAIHMYNKTCTRISSSNFKFKTKMAKVEEINTNIRNLRREQNSTDNKNDEVKNKTETKPQLPKIIGDSNLDHNSAIEGFQVDNIDMDDLGTFAYADCDIHVGTVIMVEKPYVSYLSARSYNMMGQPPSSVENINENLRHCHHCLMTVLYGLPCTQCAGVLFCSVDCRKEAWQQYHKAECRYLDALESLNSSSGRLALRVVLKNRINNMLLRDCEHEITGRFQEIEKLAPSQFWEEDTDCDNDLWDLYTLNDHQGEYICANFFKLAVLSLILVDFLEKVGFFRGCKIPLAQGRMLVACHLLHFILIANCNQFKIHDYRIPFMKLKELDDYLNILNHGMMEGRLTIGTGLYKSASYLNHSCDPNTFAFFYRNNLVLRAIRPICEGDDITVSYCQTYLYMGKDKRQKLFKDYFFTCKCIVCRQDWPETDGMEWWNKNDELVPRFRCLKLGCVSVLDPSETNVAYCPSCRRDYSIEPLLKLTVNRYDGFNPGTASKDESEKMLGELKVQIPFLEKYLVLPSAHYVLRQAMLQLIYCRMAHEYSRDSQSTP